MNTITNQTGFTERKQIGTEKRSLKIAIKNRFKT